MLLNHFKIAFRALLRFRSYAIVNILGLSLGLTAGIFMLVYVLDEFSFDQFHTNKDRIFRVETAFFNTASGSDGGTNDANGWGVGTALRSYPEVEKVMYSRGASFLLINFEGRRIREQMHFASPEFFEIFSFPLVSGNAATALAAPYRIVISERLADKYFKNGDALNKTITMNDSLEFVVSGVMKNIPPNSHIQSDAIISFETFTAMTPFDYNGGWGNINIRNYVLLRENVDVAALQAKVKTIYLEKAGETMKNWGVEAYVKLAPMADLYLTSKSNGWGPLGSLDRLILMSGIALFVIILACINFINLTTARSVYRAKEVGLRKVVGSNRWSLVRQFLSESLVLVIIAFVLSFAFLGALFPFFNELVNKNYGLASLAHWQVIGGSVVLVIVITVLSGYYPAWVLSALRPAEVLKGKMYSGTRGLQLRRFLVVFQFFISVGLVLGTLIVLNQLNYMQQQSLGFAKDEIIVVNAARARASSAEGFNTFKNELKNLSFIENVSYANSLPGTPGWTGQVSFVEGKPADQSISVEYMAIDDQYLPTLDLQLIAGRNFDISRSAELSDGLILNETAVAMYGWTSAEEALGKRIASPSGYPAGEVIGVVKDYHQVGLQREIGPMAMDYNPGSSYLFAVRYKAAKTQEVIKQLQASWRKHYPGYDFNYFFLDEEFEKQYQSEQRLASVFGLFAVITIVIAVIGLLGLVSFMITSRTKEIGVRKVLGADVFSITTLLSKEFLTLVVIGALLAFPAVFYFSQQWLETFANRAPLNPLVFILTFIIAVVVSFVTISFQTVRAAMADPVDTLRYE